MIPLDDWMVLELEERKPSDGLILPESTKDKSTIEVGDTFVARTLGPQASERIAVGDRLLFYGMAVVVGIKLPGGKKVWVGQAKDVAFKLEEGE